MKSAFPNRYADMYNVNYSSLAGNPGAEREARQKAESEKKWASLAPMAGTLLGGAAGAAIGSVVPGAGTAAGATLGSSLGGSLGSAVGAYGNADADSELDDERQRALRRQALMDAIQGMRR